MANEVTSSTACAVDDEAFIVTSQVPGFTPIVQQTFFNEADAREFRNILERNKPSRKYRVYHAIV